MSETQAKSNSFGDFFDGLKSLSSLFGADKQSFSKEPAIDNLYTQQQFASNSAAEQSNLASVAQRNSAALAQQNSQSQRQGAAEQARAMRDALGSSSASSSQGAGAFASPYATDAYGRDRGIDNRALGRWTAQRDQALQSTDLFGRANANTDIYRANAIADNQALNQRLLSETDRYNQQILGQQQFSQQRQLTSQQLAAQQAMQKAQLASQERTAQTAAQASILSSLFGSISSGNPNYRYWN